MARARGRRKAKSLSTPPTIDSGSVATGEFTGRYLVLLADNGVKEGLAALKESAGLTEVCNAADYGSGAVEMAEANESEILMLDKLKVAVVDADPTQAMALRASAAEGSAILAVEPERIMYALTTSSDPLWSGNFPFEYLRGYKDAVNHLFAAVSGTAPDLDEGVAAAVGFADNAQFTWGLQATRVSESRFAGRGIRVAVLDTGMDLDHPDFVGRVIASQSFVQGQAVADAMGHGTHCIGTALGSQQPPNGVRRYGCAFSANIFAGKVLSNQGSGGDAGILAGINWAITNQCRVISMSLGAATQPGEQPSAIYENVARRALQSNPGTLIVAAAGNESSRPGAIRPVGRPANCPSILAVAALDANLGVARFSNGGINPNGGGVDIAGPGVATFSTSPIPAPPPQPPSFIQWPPRFHSISGTSMATPHVAGIAAMWLEERGAGTSAQALWQLLTGNARRLNLASRDVGAGLVQAPV